MDWRRMPPLSALRAFAAYAQCGSVASAGAALNVSHAAISQQMRALEAYLGLGLLDRSGRQMALTPEGQALAAALNEGFATIADTLDSLTGAAEDRPLHVACTPSFAANWLMPRLADFRAAHPDVHMVIDPNPERTDPTRGGIDVALRYGDGTWPGFDSEPLMPAPLVIVGAPSLFPDGPPRHASDLLTLPWLQEYGAHEATTWLASQGVTAPRAAAITQLPGNLMIDGARRGQGIAITTRLAVAEDLDAGRLLALFEADDGKGYHILTLPGVARPALGAFLRWLRREVAKAD